MGQINQQRLSGLYKFQDECLTLLTCVVDVNHAVTYLLDDRAKPMCYKNHKMQPLMHREYLSDFYKSDPLYPANFKESRADVVKMNDLVQPYRRNTHPYYRDFVTPWGIQDIVELFFHVDGKLIAGAALFTSKDQPEILSDDLKKINHLHRFIEYSLEQNLSTPTQTSFDDFCDEYQLTAKERVVVQLVTQGLPNKSIAQNLCCSLATIKTHLQHIFSKMAVNSKAEVANLVYSQNCQL